MAGLLHAQQAAEKSLKAFLVASGIDFPKSHSIDRLADMIGDALELDRPKLIDLERWAVAGRYPEDVPEPTAEETTTMVESARRLYDDVVSALRPPATEEPAG